MLGAAIFWCFVGLLAGSCGVRGIVTREIVFTDEYGRTKTLTGLSAILVGSVFTVLGVGTTLGALIFVAMGV